MSTNPIIRTAARVEIEAKSTDAPPRFSMVAYTGGPMDVGGFGDLVVVDLDGLDIGAKARPILRDHEASRIVGHTTDIRVSRRSDNGAQLLVSGVISGSGPDAAEVIASSRQGFPWQASIGARATEWEQLRAGATATVNGRKIDGPAQIARKSILKEVSWVALGADDATSARLAAKARDTEQNTHRKGNEMSMTENDIRASERKRLADINDIVRGVSGDGVAEFKAQAINGDITLDELRGRMLEIVRASRPVMGAPRSGSDAPAAPARDIIAASVLRRLPGGAKIAEKAYGAHALEAADAHRIGSLVEACEFALRSEGRDIPRGNKNDLIRASLSGVALPTALGDTVGRLLMEAYGEAPASWRSFAAVRSVTDFRTATEIQPYVADKLSQLPPGGEIEHATMGEEQSLTYKVDTFAKTFGVDRRSIINDDIGIFDSAARAFGSMAARTLNDLVWKTVLDNGGSFYSAGNGNYLTGAGTALSVTSLTNAIAQMLQQKDSQGRSIDLMPSVLVVPPQLLYTAKQVLESEYLERTADGAATGNPARSAVRLVTESRLSNSSFTNASTTGWYLFTAPQSVPLVVAFLNGIETPTVETFGFDTNPNTLSFQWRIYHDFGCAFGQKQASVFMKGTA
jgi:hypothetical protein